MKSFFTARPQEVRAVREVRAVTLFKDFQAAWGKACVEEPIFQTYVEAGHFVDARLYRIKVMVQSEDDSHVTWGWKPFSVSYTFGYAPWWFEDQTFNTALDVAQALREAVLASFAARRLGALR